MPVGTQKETTTLSIPGGQSPLGEMNGQDIQDALTDVEDLHMDGDQSPVFKQKKMLLVPEKDADGLTDTEDMALSGDEDEIIPEKTDLPTVQDLGVLPEPVREVINLTEGYAREASPLLLSDSDSDKEDVQKRHKKNIRKVENISELQLPAPEEPEGLTDVEDMVASGDELEENNIEVEDSLPEHYLDQTEGVSNHEKLKAVSPKAKVFKQGDESSDDEKQSKKQLRRKSKASLTVLQPKEEGATDVEDLVISDLADDEGKAPSAKKETKEKIKRKKHVRRKSLPKVQVTKTLSAPVGDASGVTDTEILSGDDEYDDEEWDEDEAGLCIPTPGTGALTDTEDINDSDTEDVADIIAPPLEKSEVAVLPEPHAEKVRITETEEAPQKESEGETDEEGFQLEDGEDEKPLMPRKKVVSEPMERVIKEALEVEEPCEAVLTDTEDFDMDEKDEEDVISDMKSRIPKEGKIHTIEELDTDYGQVTKKEMVKDADAELKELIKEAELGGLTLQEALKSEALTDVEDLDEDDDESSKRKVKKPPPKKVEKEEGATDEESVDESDIEEEIRKPPPKRSKQRGRRLPLVPQVSEVRFVETEQGPLSIIITPDNLDNNPDQIVKDQVTGVVFIETEEKEATTDIEDLQSSDDEIQSRRASILNAPQVITEPATDTEDFDVDVAEVDRPLSPLPPDLNYNVLSSPKRELIHIKEDKYGVPQVSIRKLQKDELLLSDVEDLALTDTEDIEVSEAEALRLAGATVDSTSDFELPDTGVIEVSSKMTQKKQALKVDPDEEGGSTDIEELEMTKKAKRRNKTKSRLEPKCHGEDSHTDIELLSDQDDKGLTVCTESSKGLTDTEDFVASESEDLGVLDRDDAPTPDIIKNAAIRKVIIQKEGPHGVTQTEEASVVQVQSGLRVEEETGGVTDVEDMEASGGEDEDIPEHPAVELPEQEYSSVDITEKTSIPKDRNEAKHIKDNLLLPEDNYNNLTDVESLDGGEGNRCASNTSLLSGQPLTYAVESCIVEELPYTCIPLTDPTLSANAGLSLENDPFCSELTNPLVVEAELEQVYYHAPQEEPHQSEVEMAASDGCIVRKRQVVASLCQAREIRRFWSQDRNSPLQQSELSAFATPSVHRKGFKTILYLEQPNLLDTISISDTLCDSSYFKNERLMDFDSSSIESFDDHFSYNDSDIVTVVDRFNQERGSSFDDLPSPHLSSIGSSGVVDSLCSGRSFNSDTHFFDSPCLSPQPDGISSRASNQDRRHMYEPCTGSNSPVFTSSPDIRRHHDGRATNVHGETHFVFHYGETVPNKPSTHNFNQPEAKSSSGQVSVRHFTPLGSPVGEMVDEAEYIDNSTLSQPIFVSPVRKGPAVERHEGFTTECIGGYANRHYDISAKESIEENILADNSGISSEHVKGYASEYIESSKAECVEELSSEYEQIPASSCLKTSPTGYIQRSITEWVVAHNNGRYNQSGRVEEPQLMHRAAFSAKESDLRGANQVVSAKYQSPQKKELITRRIMQKCSSPVLCTREITDHLSNKSLEDSGVHMYQTSGSFTTSMDTEDERYMSMGDDSDRISIADSVLGLEEQNYQGIDDQRGLKTAFSKFTIPTSSHQQKSEFGLRYINPAESEYSLVTAYPATVVPSQWHYTQHESGKQEISQIVAAIRKFSGDDTSDVEEGIKDYGGVKGLIDQWEVIVQEEKRRSLPASPAVGRRILPPFEGKKKNVFNPETYESHFTETELRVRCDSIGQTCITHERTEELEGAVGGSVVEEVASVGDIIQQFEGRVGRLDKKSAHKQRLQRGSKSPASRSPSHPRQVATVKPLREPQLQQQDHFHTVEDQQGEPHEIAHASGFVPRVMESLSITKSSQEAHEEDPTHASVPYPEGTHEASQIAEQQATAFSQEQDVGVVFTERKEYGGGVKPSAETTGGHSHISPSPHPSQSSSLATDQSKITSTKPVSQEAQRPADENVAPSRPVRRHERTFSQASNIYTGTIPSETKQESKKGEKDAILEETDGVSESIKPYSERKQFWESVTGQSFEAKGTQLLKTETESDTDTTGTDGTVVEKKKSVAESSDSEAEYVAQRADPAFYENQAFIGTEMIDVPKDDQGVRAVSPFEVRRSEDLPSPEDIAYKDVSSKRALFEKEIKRQSMEIEESQSWKRSSKEYDETVVISEESASSTLQKKEERKQTLEETVQSEKDLEVKKETREDIVSKTDVEKTESELKKDKVSKKDDVSEITESSKSLKEKMQVKEKKSLSEVSTADSKVVTQTDLLSEKKEKESTEKAEKVSMIDKKVISQTDISKEKREKESLEKAEEIIHESKEDEGGILSRTVSKSEEKAESLSEARETIQTRSIEDQDTSRDEITEEDMTRTEETSEEEADELMTKEKVTVNVTEETRQVGDTHETVVRETTTTRDGEQEQRVIKETKTQQTVMADGSTVKTTSITTFTTQLDSKEMEGFPETSKTMREIFTKEMTDEPTPAMLEEKDVYRTMTAKEKSEAFVEQRMKSDIFSQELSSSAEDQSPEHKVITPKDTSAPVSLQPQTTEHPLSSPIRVPEESVQEIVWEVSQERSETVLSETVEDIPSQQPVEPHHVKEVARDEQKQKPTKPRRKSSSGSTKGKLSEEEARKLAIEIVEEVKMEAVKRSPVSQTTEVFAVGEADGATQETLPRPSPESAFTEETTTKIEKYIQEQLGDEVDEKQLKLIESVTARKAELLHKKMIGSEYQHSMEITDEDLRSSGAELSPIEHQMERLRQMTEEDETQRYAREPSEADESESSMIIHETADDIMSSEYDQANQMISKTLDALKTAELGKAERAIDTIKEVPETTVQTTVIESREGQVSEKTDFSKLSKLEVTETARQLVKEVTEKAQESEAVRQASLTAAEVRQAPGSREHSRTPSPKSGSRKGSWMDDEDLRREFRRDYEDKKKMFKEEMTTDKEVFDDSTSKESKEVKVSQQKSSESHKEVHMESSMTESMEESSTVESARSVESKMKAEVITSVVKEVKEVETEKKEDVVMRRKGHVEEFNRRSGTDFDAYSSSGESHYFTAAEGTSDSRTGSRPCSSDVEALISERTTGTSEYDTALTSQDASQYSSYSNTSQDYRTAASSISSRDSMKSIDSESSGHLASFELSEASETLVPSAAELERDMDLLDQEGIEDDVGHPHQPIIPQLTIQSDTPKSEDAPGSFEDESDEADFEQDSKDAHTTSKMKRSIEMTFYPEPKPLSADKKSNVTESVASSLEESTVSEVSMATVVEQDKSMQGSTTTESNMTASSVSEQMMSSVEGQDFDHQATCTDSGVLTTDTGDGDMTLHSVTITATSVPPTDDQSTASMCTQVTSETRAQVELTESEQFFRANGPTEVDYVPEYDDEEVRGARPAVAPTVPASQEAAGATAGPSEGPQKVVIVEECYETEADQEYGQMMRESEYSELAEAELQYSLEEQPEAEMSSMLVIEEPIERPRTPEPGYVPSPRPSSMIIQSPEETEEPEEFTEVDKRFSAVFSTTYEERDESNRSSVSDVMSIDVPDITVTEHTLPMPSQYCYPDLEREEDFPECRALAEAEDRGPDIPATPGSQESASTCASRKSSSTDSEQGREYCLDDMAHGPSSFGSFEMVEADDIDDFSEYERTLYMHEERMMEMSQIKEEDEEEIEEDRRLSSSPIPIPSLLKAVKIDADKTPSESQASDETEDPEESGDPTIEEQRRWLELQFEESDAANYDYQQTGFIEHVYSGPLEDIEEEREDVERRDLAQVAKHSSLSSTPEYDVLAGRKFFTRSGENDDVSMTSLQEFENLEQQVAVEAIARRASSGSQESLNGKRPESKSGHGDDISVGSFASLQEFERLERECMIVEQIEKKAQEEAAMLSEIEEGHESQMSESESCETLSEPGRASVEGEEYDQRMFEIDEIIRQAQDNVEKFDKSKSEYEGVRLQDIVSVDGSGSGSSHADRTPSVGREEGDADSLEEAQLPDLDLDQTGVTGSSSTGKHDTMSMSADSIEAAPKHKVPRETSQDSLEKGETRSSDPMTTSVDSIEFMSRQDVMTASTDSIEARRRRPDTMSASTESIEPSRRDVMATSIDSLGRDDSSGRDADISSGSEQVRPLPRDGGLMECSLESLDPTSSQATHATYQYDTDSIMSGSFTSACSNTLVVSTDDFPEMMTSSMYIPEGELPPDSEEQYIRYMQASGGAAAEIVQPTSEDGFSHTVTRVVRLPPEAKQISFTGPDAQRKMEEYIQGFNAGEHSTQEEVVDAQGNVHIRRVTQRRVVSDPHQTEGHGFSVADPSIEETETRDEHGNVTRIIRKTVVTTHTVEVDLDTGEPIVQPPTTSTSSSTATSSSSSTTTTSTSTSATTSFSRIPRPVTSPPLASRSPPPGPPPGSRGPREPVLPSLEPNTVSGSSGGRKKKTGK